MQVADRFTMEWKLFYDNEVKRVAILVSSMDHCLYDLLIRHRAGAPSAGAPLLSRQRSRCPNMKLCRRLTTTDDAKYLELKHVQVGCRVPPGIPDIAS